MFGDLDLYWLRGLLLHDDCPRRDPGRYLLFGALALRTSAMTSSR
jgi:hypothetical protein